MLQFLSDTMSFKTGLLETIGYFVISLSKKVLMFTYIVLKPINLRSWEKYSLYLR